MKTPQPIDRTPLLEAGLTATTISQRLTEFVLTKRTPKGWFIGFGVGFILLQLFFVSLGMLLAFGVGVWGNNQPVGWALDITNFVWWIGIGHAGTLISAILFLLHQKWRASINRFAEAMTLFAVMCAGIFPLFHTGRPWRAYWMTPYWPNVMSLWPQFRSPLMWDVFAVSTYASVSLLYWYVGLIPDLATMRDRAQHPLVKRIYGLMSFGWRGAASHWENYDKAYLLLAGLSTPLVVSVHTIVSWDFAVSLLPGWHTTVFPPYFVAGAVYSGFAMVLTLALPIRKIYRLEGFITAQHIDNMAKVMLATGLIVAYGYILEAFMGWYNANVYETSLLKTRLMGPYAPFFWALIFCNVLTPQVLWFKKVRANLVGLWMITIVVNIGMWLERFVIIVISLHRDFLPSSWGMYYPTLWDVGLFIGTIGLFLTLMFLFIRLLPMIPIFEIRELLHKTQHEHDHDKH